MVRDLRVEPNAILIMNGSTLHFDASCGITVSPGAQLSVLQTMLTNSEGCRGGATWKGIIVEGNPSLPQTPASNQGSLYLGTGTVVEHSQYGMSATNGIGSKTGGGIIKANGASFTDNVTGVHFDSYRSGNLPNQSYIINSTFKTTAYLQRNGLAPLAHVSLQGVSQVQIKGNTFQNASAASYDLNNRGFGVYASNGDAYIANSSLGIANTFSGLTVGVQSVGAVAAPALLVENALFNNCFTGISVSGAGSPVIRNCQFSVPDYTNGVNVASAVTLNMATPFSVLGNVINGAGTSTGISLSNICQNAGIVKENTISNLKLGITINSIGSKANLTCNTLNNNNFHIYFANGSYWLGSIIGSSRYSASNQFLPISGSSFNLVSASSKPITYYGHSSNPAYMPRKNSGKVYVFAADKLKSCGRSSAGSLEALEQYNDTIAVKQVEFAEFEDEGCTDNLMLAVESAVPGNPLPLMQRLLNASPVLSDSVMVAATIRYEVLPDAFIARVLVSNPQAPKSPAVTEAMDLRPSPLPVYFLQAINEIGHELSEIDIAKGNLEGLIGTRDLMLANMAGRLLNDTISKATDTLTMAINLMPTATTIALKALLQFEKGEHAECMETLTTGIGQVSNSIEAAELEGFSQFLATVNQTDTNDTTFTELMGGFAESPNVLVSLLAKNALLAASSTPIHAPFIEYEPMAVPRLSTAPTSPTVSVAPARATAFVVVSYNLSTVKPSEVRIAITNGKGENKWSYSPRVRTFEEIVVTEGWLPGNYTANLLHGSKSIASATFSIGGTEEVAPFAENTSLKAFYISPNPAKSTVTITLAERYASSSFSYVLLNSKGEPFKKGNGTGSVSVSIDTLLPGIYIVKVTVNGQDFTKTLVKE